MADMSEVIVPKSDQWNADDFMAGPKTFTVADVNIRGGQEQPVSIVLAGSDKVFRPCKSMCRVLAQAWGLDSKLYVGRSMTLYCDPTVKFGPLAVGGIRISHMTHIDGPMVMALTATKGVKKSYKVMPLVNAPAPQATTADVAANWANTFSSLVEQCADKDALDKLVVDRNVKLTELSTKRAELHAAVTAAIAARYASFELDAATGDTSSTEGPDDSQRGETHTATPTDEATAAEIIRLIGIEKVSDSLDALFARKREEIDGLPEDQQEAVRDAYYKRFEAVSPKGGA